VARIVTVRLSWTESSTITQEGAHAVFDHSHTWALVLAAGDGSRLRSLTTSAAGETVPKQFCSLYEGPSLFHEAVRRGARVADEGCICAVVAEQHRRWWEGLRSNVLRRNMIVQPRNRGTAIGILLPLLHIARRNPRASIVLLPSDHHVRREEVLSASLRAGAEQLRWRPDELVLLGLKPEEADPELGYIVPGPSDGRGALTVRRFVEKPDAAAARDLIEQGALWNAFILLAGAQALLAVFQDRIPEVVTAMTAALRMDELTGGTGHMTELYETLPSLDFSRDILPGRESLLRVLPVPECGWSDLGTPKRVADTLARTHAPPSKGRLAWSYLSLAAQPAMMSHGASC
jgi:mannose-1-phosphate guanylyltransferase